MAWAAIHSSRMVDYRRSEIVGIYTSLKLPLRHVTHRWTDRDRHLLWSPS